MRRHTQCANLKGNISAINHRGAEGLDIDLYSDIKPRLKLRFYQAKQCLIAKIIKHCLGYIWDRQYKELGAFSIQVTCLMYGTI